MKKENLKLRLSVKIHIADLINKKINIIYKIVIILFIGFISISMSRYEVAFKTMEKIENSINSKFNKDADTIQKSILMVKTKENTDKCFLKIENMLNIKSQQIDDLNQLRKELSSSQIKFYYGIFIFLIIIIYYFIKQYEKLNTIESEINNIENKLLAINKRNSLTKHRKRTSDPSNF